MGKYSWIKSFVIILILLSVLAIVNMKLEVYAKPKHGFIPPLPSHVRPKWPFASPTATITPTSVPSLTPTPTATPRPIPHGKKLFFVSTNQAGPKMWQGFIDPYDPQAEESQTLSIEIANSQPVESVSITIKTDNGQHPIPTMTLVEGDLLNGRWEGNWVVNDTYLYYYHAVFEARSSNGTSRVDITLR